MGRRLVVVIAAAFTAALLARAAMAPVPAKTAAELGAELSAALMSPYCPGMTLATCPSSAAGELRQEIVDRISRGESAAAVADSLAYRFGDTIRGTPEPRGFALWLWIVPALGGAVMLAFLLRVATFARGRGGAVSDAAGVDDAILRQRLDDELHELS
jgi:cytochrome c-type biogenesis protein CcmH/NrfF